MQGHSDDENADIPDQQVIDPEVVQQKTLAKMKLHSRQVTS
jgi:hypothetical protein